MDGFVDRAGESVRAGGEREWLAELYAPLLRRAEAEGSRSRWSPGADTDGAALVHEAWARLRARRRRWESPGAYFADASRAIHDVFVEQTRRRCRLKRGAGRARVSMETAAGLAGAERPGARDDASDLRAALEVLHAAHPQHHDIVGLLYYRGLTLEQAGLALGCSTRTVQRECRVVRAWLRRHLATGSPLRRRAA